MTTHEILLAAKEAAPTLARLKTEQKNAGLLAMANALEADAQTILAANGEDLGAAKGSISDVMLDRLRLTEERIASMANDIRHVASLSDPIGGVLEEKQTDMGLRIRKVRIPMGVVAMIYESRPNVTSDAATLALKSGNAAVLRCGKEAHRSSLAIVDALQKGLASVGIPEKAIQLIEDPSRESAMELMSAVGLVDLLIPRGGAGLIRSCVENAKVPVIQTGTGICHLYVDKDADPETALRVIENAKCSRPSVCNAEEVCLVDRPIAKTFLPMLRKRLTDDRITDGKEAVELRLDETAAGIIDGKKATEKDFDTEFLDYILAVKVVDGVSDAVKHIAKHSTKHSDGIITKNREAADFFTATVDSAAVYVNTSTRFTDGGEFGLGCEIGISTQKLHARGPMGLCELTTYKYIVESEGKIR